MKEKKKKEEKKKTVTRNLQPSRLGKSAQACLIFLVTFWNYPARSNDKVKEERKTNKKQKQKSEEKFQTVSSQFPQKTNEDKKRKRKRRKRKQ